ncbi:lipoprotein releasing system, permease component [Candidatus Moduliflexus flocculans]|uniref:Lipoprotein releasing system, permease component n=1 Tax=Candidatus Moduliflexus flocculans TaxID=1499966 RepID=A0A081BQN0_9BACT|nr:lipoprotein releasing system, permease component [Candidatus Moduliflexus flocculans]
MNLLQKLFSPSGSYEAFISWRYLRSKRKGVFVSFITLISICGIMLGVTALIIVLAVMTGLSGELRDKILGTHSHIMIFERGGWIRNYAELLPKITRTSRVVGAAPFIFRQVMIQSDQTTAKAMVKGIDAQAEQTTSELGGHIIHGALDFLEPDASSPGRGILLGKELANTLGVTVGSTVTLIAPMQEASSRWPIPKQQMFQVSGIFDYGMYEYDSGLVYLSLAAAQEYFQTDHQVSGIEVKVDDIFVAGRVAEELQKTLGPVYSARDWADLNKNLFAIFALYKKAMFLMLTLMVVVACLNIASSLILMVMEKNRDIAILKTMGASATSIMKLFVMQGLFIGLTGTCAGCLLGFIICRIADTYHLIRLEGGVYYLNYLPFRIMPLDFTLVAVSSLVICFFATIYPARQAAKLDPAVALRCE